MYYSPSCLSQIGGVPQLLVPDIGDDRLNAGAPEAQLCCCAFNRGYRQPRPPGKRPDDRLAPQRFPPGLFGHTILARAPHHPNPFRGRTLSICRILLILVTVILNLGEILAN